MQRIVPSIWFDHTAEEAAAFYVAALPDTRVTDTQRYPTEGLPDFQADLAGRALTVELEIAGYRVLGINAGPEFRPNPSVSFTLHFDTTTDPAARDRLDATWAALSEGGQEMMALQEYDFSPWYGWVQDRYGVSWQLMLTTSEGEPPQFVVPSLLFTGPAQNRAEEAIAYYTSLFGGSTSLIARYTDETGPAKAGAVQYGAFELLGQQFTAMDSGAPMGDVAFTCGMSLMVNCNDQAEIDRYWAALSAVPEAEACGWCADRFGLSWQLVPVAMEELMGKPGAYDALMSMGKIEIAAFG